MKPDGPPGIDLDTGNNSDITKEPIAEVPICFKETTVIPVPKKAHAICLKDYCPKERRRTCPMYINETEVERVESVKFLRVMITDNLFWTSHVDAMVKKAERYLFFLRQLRIFGMSIRILTNFDRCTTESILSGCIMAWCGNCSAQDRKKLQRVVCTAQTTSEVNLLSMDSIYMAHCRGKAANFTKDPSQP
eukprot:g38633.t1